MNRKRKATHSERRRPANHQAPDTKSTTGTGGELHQGAGGDHPSLTTNQGVPISDNQNSLKANPRGPVLLEDFILREKITYFDHERFPERIVHARGTAARGFFDLSASLERLTTARIHAHGDVDHVGSHPAACAANCSQARQYYLSQTSHEQAHIASALVFELSKVGPAAATRSYQRCREAIGKLERLATRLRIDCSFERKPSLFLARTN